MCEGAAAPHPGLHGHRHHLRGQFFGGLAPADHAAGQPEPPVYEPTRNDLVQEATLRLQGSTDREVPLADVANNLRHTSLVEQQVVESIENLESLGRLDSSRADPGKLQAYGRIAVSV